MYKTEEITLRTYSSLAVVATIVLTALAGFDIVHWAVWAPGLIAAAGVGISCGMQLNRIDELRGDKDG